MPYLLNVVFDLYTTIVLRPGGKNRTLFSLFFCLDTKERKNQFSIEDVHLGYARCPLSESSEVERHGTQLLFQEWSAAPRRRRIISDLIFSAGAEDT